LIESTWFGGDIRRWLDGGPGGATGGWLILLLPVSVLVVVVAFSYLVAPWLRSISAQWSRRQCALIDIAKVGAMTAITLLLAWGAAKLLGGGAGIDSRGGVLDTYAQRNALIVGFVMGFAVVPIIYTLAEDALSSVPKQLREGSLGAGATPWQTAWRIVIPTAMSGLFGALMVGLGRAVGETMIVLMAAGNTPIMDWNMFNGFRTLSANIAVELPEAVKNDTHYRALFLAALVLFAMTFLINTFAEYMRRIFRKRFADL
jgi:phosphate transport system permease protein